jgi:hypothetical protein
MKKKLLLIVCQLFYLVMIFGYSRLSAFPRNELSSPNAWYSQDVSNYSSDVLNQWMVMQIRLMSTTQASFNGPFIRIYAYSGIAAYAAIYPGIAESSPNSFNIKRLNSFPELPEIRSDKKYYWPASVNAALAYMNHEMFPMANASGKAAIDSLEEAIEKSFPADSRDSVIFYSAEYGRKVASAIFNWAERDGYRNGNDPYSPPEGRGMWKPTFPSYASAVTPYWGRLRTIVPGSNENTEPGPPPEYSEEKKSVFYKMVKQVYDLSNHITPEQKAIALFWKDINPGVTAPGHWLNILRQVIEKEKTPLDKAVFAYALSGIALNDTWISSWKTRYKYNLVRPITYIQTVMGFKDWTPPIPTPPHPEYPGGHAALSSAVASALTQVFGNDYSFTDHTYDNFKMLPRTYPSFWAIAQEAAISKVYGGIHYKVSVEVGLQQGRDVTQNVMVVLLNKGEAVKPKLNKE